MNFISMVGLSPDKLDAALSDRHGFLWALIKQPRPKSELEDEVDCSRSTLDRALRELAEADFIRYENGVWTPTLLGRCSYKIRESYLDRLKGFAEVSSVLNELPFDSPLNCVFLAGSNVYEAGSSMPDAVLRVLLDSVEAATEVYIATPVLIAGFTEKLYNRMARGGEYSLEIVLPRHLFEQIHTAFPTFANKLSDDSHVNLYRTSIPFTYGLWMIDSSEAGIIAFTEQGIRGIAVNETEDAIEGARNQYKRVKRDAEQIGHPGRIKSNPEV